MRVNHDAQISFEFNSSEIPSCPIWNDGISPCTNHFYSFSPREEEGKEEEENWSVASNPPWPADGNAIQRRRANAKHAANEQPVALDRDQEDYREPLSNEARLETREESEWPRENATTR